MRTCWICPDRNKSVPEDFVAYGDYRCESVLEVLEALGLTELPSALKTDVR